MSRHDADRLTYDEVTIFGVPALFTDLRVDRSTVPDGVYRYEVRYSDEYGRESVELAHGIMVDFFGTVLTREPIQLPISGGLELNDGNLEFQPDGGTLAEFQQKYPASEKRVIDFFIAEDTVLHDLCHSQTEEQDKVTGCIGHLRGDFGSGKQFFTTWWPHQNDMLNTPEFKADIERTVNWLREQPDSPLRDFDTMKRCCTYYQRSCAIKDAIFPSCAFLVESKQYVYMLRCTPTQGDYNFYMYCYQRATFEKYRAQLKNKARSHAKKRAEPER